MTTTKITSNAGRYKDSAPHIYAAGKVNTDPGDSVLACMKQETATRPATPPQMQPYRKSYVNEPGRMTTHFGKAFDAPPPNIRFGATNDYSDNAATLIHPGQDSWFTEKQKGFKESVYATSRKEPLGKPMSHHPLPEHTQAEDFKFGAKTRNSESAKNLMYPLEETNEQMTDSIRKPKHLEAGEQRKRGYEWDQSGIDPSTFRFGHKDRNEAQNGHAGVAQALKPDEDRALRTTIVRKTVEEFKEVGRDELGKPRKLGHGERDVDETHVFGKGNRYDDWGARECLRGNYEVEDQLPDRDLGKATKSGFRNDLNTGDRVFGVPTIRTDINKPRRKRVTDFQNYGDEPKAVGMLFPSRFADKDVFEEDFMQPIDKRTMFELCDESGLRYAVEDFESAWNLASSYTTDGAVCIETFKRACDELGL